MKLTTSFAALSSVVVIALCLGQAQADTVTTPLGLTQVDDKGAPITPLTYLNLAPASKSLSDAAKKITTPPQMIKEKRLLPTPELQPMVEQFTSQGLSIRDSLLPTLPIIGNLDNEGSYTNARPPAPVEKRLLDALKSLAEPSATTQFMPENHQSLGQRTEHPLNRRGDPIDVSFFGKALPIEMHDKLKLPGSKRGKSSGLNVLGHEIPLDELSLPTSKRENPVDVGLKSGDAENLAAVQKILSGLMASKRGESPLDLGVGNSNPLDMLTQLIGGAAPIKRAESPLNLDVGNGDPVGAIKKLLAGEMPYKRGESPLDLGVGNSNPLDTLTKLLGGAAPIKRAEESPFDLGLQTGNAQDLEKAKSLLASILPAKRAEETPYDFGLKMGNAQDMERAQHFLAGLLGNKRDTISPDHVDLSSLKNVGGQAAKEALPLALMPVKQTASPAVQVLKTGEGLCTSFGCQAAAQNALGSVTKELPVPLPAARSVGGEDELVVKRAQDPVVDTVLGTSDAARDAILDLKTKADDAAGSFVKNMYSKHGEITTKRAINIPSYSLLPGTGPMAKEGADQVKEGAEELVGFIGLPIPGVPATKRMEKVRRKE